MASALKRALAVLASACLAGAPARADEIILRSDVWCPYTCEPSAERPGYMVEIAQRILRDAGHTVRYELVNWARLKQLPGDGAAVAVLGVGRNRETLAKYAFPALEAGAAPFCFFTMPGQSWQYRGPRSLREIRLGVVNGYQYGPSVDAALRAPAAAERVSWATGVRASEGNLKKLALGRLDAVLEDRQVMRYLSWAGAGEDRVELRTATCLSEEPPELYVVFERSNPNARRYAQQFSEGMRRLRASGALAEVLGRYGLSDWRHP